MTRMWLVLQRKPAGKLQQWVLIDNFFGQILHSIIVGVCGFVTVLVLHVLYAVSAVCFPGAAGLGVRSVWLSVPDWSRQGLCAVWHAHWRLAGGFDGVLQDVAIRRGWWRPEVLVAAPASAPEFPAIQRPSGYSRSDRRDGSLMNIMSKKMQFKHTVQILEGLWDVKILPQFSTHFLLYCLKL